MNSGTSAAEDTIYLHDDMEIEDDLPDLSSMDLSSLDNATHAAVMKNLTVKFCQVQVKV